jgi:hypothetical protein
MEQKMAAFRYHITRMHSLPLDTDKKKKEWTTIQATANNNNFPQRILEKLIHQIQNRNGHTQKEKRRKKNLDHVYIPQPPSKKNY